MDLIPVVQQLIFQVNELAFGRHEKVVKQIHIGTAHYVSIIERISVEDFSLDITKVLHPESPFKIVNNPRSDRIVVFGVEPLGGFRHKIMS